MTERYDPPTREELELWSRSFVDWSQSRYGFYVRQRYDVDRRRWVYGAAPIQWLPFQQRLLRWVYTIREDGTLPLSEFYYIDVGKSGKTLLQAAVAQWFGMFVERDAELYIAANSKNQADVRVFHTMKTSIRQHPRMSAIVELTQYGDVHESEIRFRMTGNIARAVPIQARSVAGGNLVFRGFDEMWGLSADQRELVAQIKESPTRNISHLLVTTYPGYADDDGPLNDQLNDFFEDDETPRSGVRKVEGLEDLPFWVKGSVGVWWNHDATRYPWHTPEFIARQLNDPKITPAMRARVWEARRPMREEAFMPLARWDECVDDELQPLGDTESDVPIVAAVDLGVKIDSSAVVVRSYNPVTRTFDLRAHRIWRPEDFQGHETDIIISVQDYIYTLHRKHLLLGVAFDPSQALHMMNELKKLGVKTYEFTQISMRELADTNYRLLISTRRLRNYADCYDLRQHVAHAVAIETGRGTIRLDKRKSSFQIDAAVADSMCCWLAEQLTSDFERLARQRKRMKEVPSPARTQNVWRELFRL